MKSRLICGQDGEESLIAIESSTTSHEAGNLAALVRTGEPASGWSISVQMGDKTVELLSEQAVMDWISQFEQPENMAHALKRIMGCLSPIYESNRAHLPAASTDTMPGSSTLPTDLPLRKGTLRLDLSFRFNALQRCVAR